MDAPPPNITHARDAIAKLNWKLIETAAMLPHSQRAGVIKFQQSVTDVSAALSAKLDAQGCDLLLRKINVMALDGAMVIQGIGRHVELSGS